MHVKTTHVKGMSFRASSDEGISFIMDSKPQHGGQNAGPTPKEVMLASLAGCTGMDIVSILGKMRMNYEHFEMDVEGDLTTEDPKIFHTVHLTYKFTGQECSKDKIIKAIQLSQNKYCGIGEMFKSFSNYTFSLKINDAPIEGIKQ